MLPTILYSYSFNKESDPCSAEHTLLRWSCPHGTPGYQREVKDEITLCCTLEATLFKLTLQRYGVLWRGVEGRRRQQWPLQRNRTTLNLGTEQVTCTGQCSMHQVLMGCLGILEHVLFSNQCILTVLHACTQGKNVLTKDAVIFWIKVLVRMAWKNGFLPELYFLLFWWFYFLLDLGCSSWQMLLLGRNLLIHLLLLFVCLFVLCECNNMSCSHRVSTRGEKSLQNPWIHSLKNAVHRRSVVYDPTGSFSWST